MWFYIPNVCCIGLIFNPPRDWISQSENPAAADLKAMPAHRQCELNLMWSHPNFEIMLFKNELRNDLVRTWPFAKTNKGGRWIQSQKSCELLYAQFVVYLFTLSVIRVCNMWLFKLIMISGLRLIWLDLRMGKGFYRQDYTGKLRWANNRQVGVKLTCSE